MFWFSIFMYYNQSDPTRWFFVWERLRCEAYKTMRLSNKQIRQLQIILKDETNKEYSEEELQLIGLAIVRFIIAKHFQSKESSNG